MNIRAWAVAIALACGLAVCGMAGCATGNAGSVTSDTDEHSAVEDATSATRTITFPAVYFEGESEGDVVAVLEKAGCTDVAANGDGTYTATMPLDKYNELVDMLHENVRQTLDAIPCSEEYPSIKAIDYDDAFENITMISTVPELGFSEMFVNWTAGLAATMYQQIAGQPVRCSVVVLDEKGDTVQSGVYPDDFEALADEEVAGAASSAGALAGKLGGNAADDGSAADGEADADASASASSEK